MILRDLVAESDVDEPLLRIPKPVFGTSLGLRDQVSQQIITRSLHGLLTLKDRLLRPRRGWLPVGRHPPLEG